MDCIKVVDFIAANELKWWIYWFNNWADRAFDLTAWNIGIVSSRYCATTFMTKHNNKFCAEMFDRIFNRARSRGPTILPATRTTKISPRPLSKRSSGETLESEQPIITARGCCALAISVRRFIDAIVSRCWTEPFWAKLRFPSNRLWSACWRETASLLVTSEHQAVYDVKK